MENNLDERTKAFVDKIQQKFIEGHYEALLNPLMTCIYALEMNNQTVKIGKTRNFGNRMKTIATSSGLEVIRCYYTEYVHHDTATKIEHACHETFDTFRIKGEFFKITFEEACAELKKYADEIKEANRKFKEETAPAIQKEYDEYLESIRKTGSYSFPKVENAVTVQNQPPVIEAAELAIRAVKDIATLSQIMKQYLDMSKTKAILNAILIVESVYEFNFDNLKNEFLAIEKNVALFTPTQIGELIGGKSAQFVNKKLCEIGFQKKDRMLGYILTEKGKEYGKLVSYNNNGHIVRQIKWSAAVSEFFLI